MTPARVRVELGVRGYDVEIGRGALQRAGEAAHALGARTVAVVTDDRVGPLWAADVEASLAAAGLRQGRITVPAGEATKNFRALERVCEGVLDLGLERQDLILALGGGMVGDLAGLAAGLVKRGIGFIQAPTTLLAQVDSSVGGKTAINSRNGKNLIGLFHQPRLVLADLAPLATLPARELRAGFAEVIKYGLIDDPDFFAWCEAHFAPALAAEPAALLEAVRRSVAAKARVVAGDEREDGARALLNLGHTFGHALELCAGYGDRLVHGEAVATGMALAFRLSVRLGLCPPEDAARVDRLLLACGFATHIRPLGLPDAEPAALLTAMAQDKKNQHGRLTLILARGIGRAFIAADAPVEAVRALLEDECRTT